MRSPISVTIGNLVMRTVDTKALQTFQNPRIMWKRYVDDTFVVIKKNNLEIFHEHLNNIEASTKIYSRNRIQQFPAIFKCLGSKKKIWKFDNQILICQLYQ